MWRHITRKEEELKILNNKKKIYIITGVIIAVISIIACLVIEKNDKSDQNILESYTGIQEEDNHEQEKKNIIIHVIGEVKNPGIVEVPKESRVKDVIEKAGGLTEHADLSRVNLAYVVQDQQKIIIPNTEDKMSNNQFQFIDETEEFIETESTSKININTATQSEFETLTGIGPSMAAKIVDYRKQNGKFKTVEDIKNVPGIGSSKYESIKDEICVR